jgi:uncharacterized cupin superfamily protein
MPVIPPDSRKHSPDLAMTGPSSYIDYSDMGGLTQFGAFVEFLPPGSKSSIKHWHAEEDEFIFMLSGTVVLHEGDSETDFSAGEVASFKAGVALGHCLENRGSGEASYLVVGTRRNKDTVTYPDDDCILEIERDTGRRSFRRFDGTPRTSPYTT